MATSQQARPGRKSIYWIALAAVVMVSLYSYLSPDPDVDSESQFSGWDDAQILLTNRIKDRLFEPDSYEHVETNREVVGETVSIVTRFRVSNPDGELEMNEVTATASTTGGDNDMKILAWKRLEPASAQQ